MSGKLIDDDQPIAEINIIPFVDIILVILIIFMVTAPFIVKTGFSLDLPKASSSQSIKEAEINITINVNGEVLLNGDTFDIEKMEDHLKNNNMKPDDTRVIISADKNVLHGKVISIINTVKAVGLTKVAIATKKSN